MRYAQGALGLPYVVGTYGKELTGAMFNELARTHPGAFPENAADLAAFRQRAVGRRTFDCVGLIKGYLWSSENGVVRYAEGGVPNLNPDALFARSGQRGLIETIPEVPGLLVWHRGHVGIYAGGGSVLEARPGRGVVRTRLTCRPFTHWAYCPYCRYEKEESAMNPGRYQVTIQNDTFLNLRAGPGINFPVIRQLKKGAIILLTGAQGSWAKVKGDTDTGFVSLYNNGVPTLTRLGDLPRDDKEKRIAELEDRLATLSAEYQRVSEALQEIKRLAQL